MTYNTMDEGSLPSNSLHGVEDTYEDIKIDEGDVDLKRAAFGQRTQKDISMDLNDLLQEMEGERDENHSNHGDSSDSSFASLALDIEDSDSLASFEEKIGSKLALDDMPSSSKGLDWGSLNWGSFMGSFRKRVGKPSMGGSRRLLRRMSSKKIKSPESDELPSKRKKVVRFKKFETVFGEESFVRSFSRLRTDEGRNHNC